MSGHTPGPWVVDAGKPLMVLAENGGFAVLISEAGRKVTTTDKANARLIAAAPDLLEALREMLAAGKFCIDTNDDALAMLRFGKANDAANAAISKAQGR